MLQKRLRYLSLLLFFLPVFSSAQEKPYVEPSGLNNWYIEIGGAGYLYSFNYEKILYKSEHTGWVGRVGIGYNHGNLNLLNTLHLDPRTFMIPFTTAMLLGSRERKEKIEIGGGFTLLAKGVNNREVVYTGVLGFRVIETNKICFRASYTPLISKTGFINWFGISLGLNFSIKR